MVKLEVKPPGGKPFIFRLEKKEVRLGRGARADLVLDDPRVSRDHALLTERTDGVFLKDLGSFNGTFVNGRRIYEVRLSHGDVIHLGATEIVFEEEPADTIVRTKMPPLPGEENLERAVAVPLHPSLDRTVAVPRLQEAEETIAIRRDLAKTPGAEAVTPAALSEMRTIVQRGPLTAGVPEEQAVPLLLRVKPPQGAPFLFPLDEEELSIGRSGSCHLVLRDQLLSRKHAVIRKTPEGFLLEDQGSSNGTYVNDERIQRRLIIPGDRIRLGVSLLTVEEAEAALAQSPFLPLRDGGPVAREFDLSPFASLFQGEVPLHILVAHSESGRIGNLLRFLKQAGAVLHDVAGKEAVLAFVQGTPPDLILLSPSLNRSLDLVLELRDRKAEVPILVLMEDQEWEGILPFIKAGADDVLMKEEPYELFLKLQKLVELYRLRRGVPLPKKKEEEIPGEAPKASQEAAESLASSVKETRRDFSLLLASRASSRIGDGFLRIVSILLVASKTKDPMMAGLVLVFRYVCEILINAISGPFIDKIRIRNSLMTADLLRTILSLMLVGAVLLESPYAVYLALSFLGDFVFIFFKPAADKMVKVTFPVKEGTKVLSRVDAANHLSNIGGYALASGVAGWIGLETAVFFGPLLFFFSFLMVSRLRLTGESVIDYKKVRKQSYWASQREGLKYTWGNRPLRLLLIGRSLVAVGRGSFTVLSVVYLAGIAKGLTAYGYFESAQSAGKVVMTALIIPFFFAYRSTFFLTGMSLILIGLAFFGFNQVNDVWLACLVGALVGAGQASEAVGIDAILNRYSEAHIQGRAKSTTSFGSRISGLAAIGIIYLLVTTFQVSARTLFGWLGIFPFLGAVVFFKGWKAERAEVMNPLPVREERAYG
jgi:pSer/pThr/pTyr-binding forkhead associated (FHA) protein/DNA-binding NarL/FixJ family response regulator/MFS family permease